MEERERKMMAFMAGMLWKLATDQELDLNETQQLDNIMCELGFQDLDEKESVSYTHLDVYKRQS